MDFLRYFHEFTHECLCSSELRSAQPSNLTYSLKQLKQSCKRLGATWIAGPSANGLRQNGFPHMMPRIHVSIFNVPINHYTIPSMIYYRRSLTNGSTAPSKNRPTHHHHVVVNVIMSCELNRYTATTQSRDVCRD